jgi:hypothetical protein
MTSKVAYIVKESGVTLFKDGRQFSAPSDFWSFNRIIEKIKNQDFNGIEELFNTKEAVEAVQKEVSAEVAESLGEEVRIIGGEVFVGDKKVYNSVTQRLVKMLASGFDVKPLSNFLKRLLKNPSRTAIQECYPFMEKADVTIDEEGYIIAYKKVRNDYFDIYSGTVNYNIGNIVEMPRNEVDDNRSNLCSDGLHFCSFSYLGHFGSGAGNRVLIVKVDPADVVSIPADYNDAKARACRMEVIGEIEEQKDVLAKTPVYKKTESAPAQLMNEVQETGVVKIYAVPYIANDAANFAMAVSNKVGRDITFAHVDDISLSDETLKSLTNVYNNLVSVYNVIQDAERRPTVAMFKCSKVDAIQRIVDLSGDIAVWYSDLNV